MRSYCYYLFDIDRTLWDFDRNADAALRRIVASHPKLRSVANQPDHFIATYEANNHRLWEEYEAGRLTKEDLRWRRFHDTLLELGISDEALGRELGETYLSEMVMGTDLMPYSREVLESIRQKGGKIGAITNGFKEVQHQKLERSGILQYFETLVISEEVGYLKPHPEIFRIALEKLSGISAQTEPERWEAAKKATLMVGDDARNDIEGARLFGIDQYFAKKNAAIYGIEATYQADDLRLLLD